MALLMQSVGNRHEGIVIIKILHRCKQHNTRYLVKCDCGKEFTIAAGNFKKQKGCRDCGFKLTGASRMTHGAAQRGNHDPIYEAWKGIKARCSRKSSKFYYGKGIKLCEEWKDYLKFQEWSKSNGYEKGFSIDRLDTNKDYCPQNCRWIARTSNNKRVIPQEVVNAAVAWYHEANESTITELQKSVADYIAGRIGI